MKPENQDKFKSIIFLLRKKLFCVLNKIDSLQLDVLEKKCALFSLISIFFIIPSFNSSANFFLIIISAVCLFCFIIKKFKYDSKQICIVYSAYASAFIVSMLQGIIYNYGWSFDFPSTVLFLGAIITLVTYWSYILKRMKNKIRFLQIMIVYLIVSEILYFLYFLQSIGDKSLKGMLYCLGMGLLILSFLVLICKDEKDSIPLRRLFPIDVWIKYLEHSFFRALEWITVHFRVWNRMIQRLMPKTISSRIPEKYIIPCISGIMSLVVLVCICVTLTRQKKVEDLLSLGQAYLEEGEYKQAVALFDDVISMIPSLPEGYIGRAYAEAGNNDILPAVRDIDYAVSLGADDASQLLDNVIEMGLINAVSEGDLDAAEMFLEDSGHSEDYAPGQGRPGRFIIDALAFLKKLQSLCLSGDYELVLAELGNNDYREIVSKVIRNNKSLYLVDKTTGKMTAMYRVDGSTENFESSYYMLYHGAHNKKLRDGDGVWLGYNGGNNYKAEGFWAKDMPQGVFNTRSWQVTLNESVSYRNIVGEIENGLWNGILEWSFEHGDAKESFDPSFNKGKWIVKYVNDDGERIAAENKSGSYLLAGDDDENWGIAGFADQA